MTTQQAMTHNEIVDRLARREGWRPSATQPGLWERPTEESLEFCRFKHFRYFWSHDALRPVLVRLSKTELHKLAHLVREHFTDNHDRTNPAQEFAASLWSSFMPPGELAELIAEAMEDVG